MKMFNVPAGTPVVFVPQVEGEHPVFRWLAPTGLAPQPLPDRLLFAREELVADQVTVHNGNADIHCSPGLCQLASQGWYFFHAPDGGGLVGVPGQYVEVW